MKAFAFLEQGREGMIILGQSRTEVQVYTQQTILSPLRQRSRSPGRYEMISTAASTLLFLHSSFGVPPERFEDKNLPLLVLIHGGPYNYPDLNLFHADWYECAVMMATDGWLVFQPNYRGSGGRLLHSNGRRLNRLCRLW